MEEFTMRNFLKQWKAILPLAIIFTFIGLIAGLVYSNMQVQKYSVTYETLVVNATENMQPEDFVAIANSRQSVSDQATKEAGVDKSCGYKATKSGNVVKITSTCESNADDAQKLSQSVVDVYSRAIVDIYGNENLEVKTITRGESEEQVTTVSRVLYVLIPAIVGLALSAFIAFIKLDHATSKKRS